MSGYVYVTVSGEKANGDIMMLANGSGTGGTVTYWLSWETDNGFTGTGWETAYKSMYCPLQNSWPAFVDKYGLKYDKDVNGFKKYMSEVRPGDLNEMLDGYGWNDETKLNFIQESGYSIFNSNNPYIKNGCLE